MTSVSAEAKSVYRWETEDGVVSFADELKRVPKRYRDHVKQINTNSLASAKRFSKIAEPAKAGHAEQVTNRLEDLRVLNAGVVVDSQPSDGAASKRHPIRDVALQGLRRSETRIQTVDQVIPTLHFGPEADADAPVVVEKVRVRSDGRSPAVTRRVTVIRQGEQILAVIKPARRAYGMDFPDESDLESGR